MINRCKPYINFKDVISSIQNIDELTYDPINKFEREVASYIGSKYALGVDQGRTALIFGLKALGIKSGDEIIVQSLICQVVIDAIIEVGAKPILVDNNIFNYNILINSIRPLISKDTKAIIVAHLYGATTAMDEIIEIAQENNLYLIEDCAHILGGKWKGKMAGSFGDIAFLSFNFDKPISTGSGGMVLVNNSELIPNFEIYRNKVNRVELDIDKNYVFALLIQHTLTQKENYKQTLSIDFGKNIINKYTQLSETINNNLDYITNENDLCKLVEPYYRKEMNFFLMKRVQSFIKIGYNKLQRMDEVLYDKNWNQSILMNKYRAQTGLINLKNIEKVNEFRNKNANIYVELLSDNESYSLPEYSSEIEPAFLRYTILAKKIETKSIFKLSKERGFELGNFNWFAPVHKLNRYSTFRSTEMNKLENSEYISEHMVNLPTHYYVSEDNMFDICSILNNISRC